MIKKTYSLIIVMSIIISAVVLIVPSCNNITERSYMNINIFRNTEAWELAQAVDRQNEKKIKEIAEANPELLNYQDEEYRLTLLIWAVGVEKYPSVEALLEAGADPDIISDYLGYNALFLACGYSWIDNDAKEDAKYVDLLLKYNADPNMVFVGGEGSDTLTEIGTSPLMESIDCGIDKIKALIDAGADLNYKTSSGQTAAIQALLKVGPNSTIEPMRVAHYIIAEKKAEITGTYKNVWMNEIVSDKENSPVDLLRNWLPKLDTEEYKLKLEVIQEFKNQGIDYWSTKIPDERLTKIKKLYPDAWEDYSKRY